jgi:hypothetical protein
MVGPDYYSSERFIQDALVQRVEVGISTLYDTWKKKGCISPFIILWPASAVLDSRGVRVDGPCLRELDPDKSQWRRQMVEAVKLTNAYALLLTQQRDDQVLLILESQHGVVNWAIPIRRSGDAVVLGRSRRAGSESVGLLWRPTSQPS